MIYHALPVGRKAWGAGIEVSQQTSPVAGKIEDGSTRRLILPRLDYQHAVLRNGKRCAAVIWRINKLLSDGNCISGKLTFLSIERLRHERALLIGEPVNLGSGYEISIRNLAEMIARMTGFEGKLVWQTDKPNGQPRRGLDVSRAKEYFGWSAQVPFEEGMRRTIDWFKANRDRIR